MKKLLGCLLVVALSLLLICASAEEFSLRNGVKFGMTEDKVIQTEEIGFEDADWSKFTSLKAIRSAEALTLAGADGTIVYFFDKNEGLVACFYRHNGMSLLGNIINDSDNQAVIDKLTEKYGQPIGEGSDYVSIGKYIDAVDWYNEAFRGETDPYDLTFYQWLAPTDDGYVDIMFLYTRYRQGSPDSRTITYTFRTNEEVEAVLDQIQQKEDSLNNDL